MIRMEGTDAAAVAQVLAGDRDAFRVLVERHSRSLFRVAFRMTGNENDAEEVVQETFLRAYRNLSRFEQRANFGTWLYRIAINCAHDLRRVRQKHDERREPEREDEEGMERMDTLPSGDPGPDRVVFSREVQRRVAAAMEGLGQLERAAFVLRHFEGYSIEEIGRTLGLRESATKNSIFRAVQKLRRALEPVVSTTR
jgi:RNA polymerase sigma-70 factor (ECF subfamily)